MHVNGTLLTKIDDTTTRLNRLFTALLAFHPNKIITIVAKFYMQSPISNYDKQYIIYLN